MNKDKLISQQALEIAVLKEKLKQYADAAQDIRNEIFCIGGPLNDNVHQYTHKQLWIFSKIIEHIEL